MPDVCQRNWVMEIFMLGWIWDTLEGKVMMNYTYTWSVSWSKKIVTNTFKLCSYCLQYIFNLCLSGSASVLVTGSQFGVISEISIFIHLLARTTVMLEKTVKNINLIPLLCD